MGFSAAKLNCYLLVLVIGVAVAAFSAAAQQAGRRPGQAIIFSSPDGEDVSSNVPSLTAKPPGLLDLANAVQSPGVNPDPAAQTPMPVMPQVPPISPAQIQQVRQQLDEQKNWAMRTPEEILGLPTQKKILGVTDRDALGQPKNESVAQQYFNRLDQSQTRTNNDHSGPVDLAARQDPMNGQGSQFNPDIWTGAGGKPGNPALMNPFSTGTTDNRSASTKTPQNGWLKSFNLPAPSSHRAPEQEFAADPFQALRQLHPASGGDAKPSLFPSPFVSPSAAVPAAVPPPATIPVGLSYTPANSGITMPAGVAPLPGLFNQTNQAPAFEPAGKPQPPPWESSAPQLGVMPQRKF